MKTGIMVENSGEFEKIAPVDFITCVLCNIESFKDLHGAQKRKLAEYGYTAEKFDSFMPLVKIAKHWAFETGVPYNHVFDAHEITQWKELTNICEIVS